VLNRADDREASIARRQTLNTSVWKGASIRCAAKRQLAASGTRLFIAEGVVDEIDLALPGTPRHVWRRADFVAAVASADGPTTPFPSTRAPSDYLQSAGLDGDPENGA